MAKLPEKIEDWTPPWEKRGEDFDAETAKELIFTLMHSEQTLKAEKAASARSLADVQSKLTEAENRLAAKPQDEAAKDAEISTLRTKVSKLESEGRQEDQALIQRLEVAIEHGLTKRDARRLVGDTLEELEEDAAELAERLGVEKGTAGGGSDDGGQRSSEQPPSRGVVPAGNVGNGRNRRQDAGPVLSPEDILEGKGLGGLGSGPQLAPLTR